MIEEEALLELEDKIRKYKHCKNRENEQEMIKNNAYKCCYLDYYVDKKITRPKYIFVYLLQKINMTI